MDQWIPKRRDHLMYKILGPTSVHLQHECYLLMALIFLAISSLQALHGENFGSWGDCKFLFITTLWLARHVIVRWLCTCDHSTSRSPTITGLLVFWITSHCMAGQYFDRPNPQAVAKHLGTSNADDGRIVATLSSFFPPSILHLRQLMRVRIWFPLLALQERLWSLFSGKRPSTVKYAVSGRRTPSPKSSLGVNQAYSYWNDFWSLYGIPLQTILPGIIALLYIWYSVSDMGQSEITYALTMNTRSMDEESLDIKAHGAYKKLEKPTLTQMLVLLSVGGTLATILLYNQIILPFPDLVAGSNVLKAVRNEAKVNIHQTTKAVKSKSQRENVDLPISEQSKAIVGENRFRLICKILFVRLIESILVCTVLPRTNFACRFTGHCPEGLSVAELSKIFFPVGITSPLRTDTFYRTESPYITPDVGAATMTILSVFVTTSAILLVQAATLNRSYLGIMGYVAGGWSVVDCSDPSIAGTNLSQWDPRRRYKKGDLIEQSYPGLGSPTIYKATSNSPEGRPVDLFLRATYDLFRNEVGHPATSNIVAYASAAQLFLSLLTIFMILCYQALDYGYGSLLWILTANLMATYGILRTAMPRYSELEVLATEIAQK